MLYLASCSLGDKPNCRKCYILLLFYAFFFCNFDAIVPLLCCVGHRPGEDCLLLCGGDQGPELLLGSDSEHPEAGLQGRDGQGAWHWLHLWNCLYVMGTSVLVRRRVYQERPDGWWEGLHCNFLSNRWWPVSTKKLLFCFLAVSWLEPI